MYRLILNSVLIHGWIQFAMKVNIMLNFLPSKNIIGHFLHFEWYQYLIWKLNENAKSTAINWYFWIFDWWGKKFCSKLHLFVVSPQKIYEVYLFSSNQFGTIFSLSSISTLASEVLQHIQSDCCSFIQC